MQGANMTTPAAKAHMCQAAGRDYALLQIIKKQPGITTKEASAQMKECPSTTRHRMINLVQLGLIRREDDRPKNIPRYHATDKESNLLAVLAEIEALQPAALELIRKGGYIFDKDAPQTEADKWQRLAFALYTDLCKSNDLCRQALARVQQ